MSSSSPQRPRKQQQQQPPQPPQPQQQAQQNSSAAVGAISSSTAQAGSRREPSPSPSMRERQRYARTQSMPIVAPLSQIQPAQPQAQPPQAQQSLQQQLQGVKTHQRHASSPQPESVYKGATYRDMGVQDDSQLPQLHPPLVHMNSFPQLQANSLPLGNPRPQRTHPPQFLSRLQDESDNWQMTPELLAEIERADQHHQHHQQQLQQQLQQLQQAAQQPAAPGAGGVAYAGGAGSSTLFRSATKGAADRPGARDVDGDGSGGGSGPGARKQAQVQTQTYVSRERERTWDPSIRDGPNTPPAAATAVTTTQRIRAGSRPLTPELHAQSPRRTSPVYYAQAQIQAPTPPALQSMRRGANGSPTVPPPAGVGQQQAQAPSPLPPKNRTPDRSLPVQEEDEGSNGAAHLARTLAHGHASPVPSSDLNPTNDLRGSPKDRERWMNGERQGSSKDTEATLIDIIPGPANGHKKLVHSDENESELSYTPRSPSAALPEHAQGPQKQLRSIHDVLQSDDKAQQAAFNAVAFEQTVKKLQQHGALDARRAPSQPQYMGLSSRNESRGSYPYWLTDLYADGQLYDELVHQIAQSPNNSSNPRPGAPVPPTPHSQTGPQSPLPRVPLEPVPRTLIPPFSPAPPGGTPYPYPFAHLRRAYVYPSHNSARNAVATPATAGAGAYDPQVVQEQLEMQLQMYALNNGAGAMTDSTFSPASTPYPGLGNGYHPFSAFMSQSQQIRGARYSNGHGLGAEGEGDGDPGLVSASLRSSPSHMPVPLPLPPFRGRALKKRNRFVNLRNGGPRTGDTARTRVKPPPRVESTQPKDTSPEPSSGEETAGEKFDQRQGPEVWVDVDANGQREDDNGEWVDEDSEDEDDYLDLEYHPQYVSNVDKRRKRFEQKWNDLVTAFEVLDQQTDCTMVLLASPSHTSTLHSLSSRGIRRDASLYDAPAMLAIKDSFAQIASQRRAARTRTMSLVERLYAATSGSDGGSNGSPTSAGGLARETDLKRALSAAIGSLNAMKQMYDLREARWHEESRRITEERENMEMMMGQVLGTGGFAPSGIGQLGNGPM